MMRCCNFAANGALCVLTVLSNDPPFWLWRPHSPGLPARVSMNAGGTPIPVHSAFHRLSPTILNFLHENRHLYPGDLRSSNHLSFTFMLLLQVPP
ncbi:hypothetical protein M378DRAFT_163550 [Amanita muscaria Koide BX008]|uniref:Secreted protein n=1 Tax=Amanita muscaria (strain Koide BX008) TaxID=946122 RepID=A0A0C2X6C3_AMAMK|nr:hypothetical protein M378DRAFT_163550 [Amanita muscaria Koide BX008]